MAEIYNRTLVETKAAMLLIPHSARILAKNTPPSSVLSCTPSPVHRASRTPSQPHALSAFRPYMRGLARLGCQVGSPLFRAVLSQRATACDPEEIQHPFRSRMLSVALAVK